MLGDQEDLLPGPAHRQQALDLGKTGAGPEGGAVPGAAQGQGLDGAQRFAEATSFEVRDAFETLVRRDLLGPWGGEREEFAPKAMGPRERK